MKQGCVAVLGELLSETSMVMMALEGLERILQVGDEEAKRIIGPNPYAALLSTSRIEVTLCSLLPFHCPQGCLALPCPGSCSWLWSYC